MPKNDTNRVISDHCYIQGYTAAIQDAIEVVDYIQTDLKRHGRKQNAKTYRAILKCMLKGRVLLRESHTAFVGFEIWDSRYNNMSQERAAAVIAALCGEKTMEWSGSRMCWKRLQTTSSIC